METISCEDVRKLCQALIRQPSLSGQEEGASLALQTYMKEQGVFDTIRVDDYGNILASIKGCRPGRSYFDGHIDAVPVEDETAWTYPPFAGEIHDGRLYGRGASDMKGALAAMTVELYSLPERQERTLLVPCILLPLSMKNVLKALQPVPSVRLSILIMS